ncbi:hypothetical protein DOTSEDRAFT_53391 [Dothistroma septosporum NZE10]|uniref:Uncharacterized protein n=1 Tax=Dothistroma septosporum (strain NZE10 / CBS 128990) TaxID=675120 RepID=N1PL49_DOTSN|nr:hypothetical protein DOTSEDRAFT_53391 [Dothistroma septosporum NZE10]
MQVVSSLRSGQLIDEFRARGAPTTDDEDIEDSADIEAESEPTGSEYTPSEAAPEDKTNAEVSGDRTNAATPSHAASPTDEGYDVGDAGFQQTQPEDEAQEDATKPEKRDEENEGHQPECEEYAKVPGPEESETTTPSYIAPVTDDTIEKSDEDQGSTAKPKGTDETDAAQTKDATDMPTDAGKESKADTPPAKMSSNETLSPATAPAKDTKPGRKPGA